MRTHCGQPTIAENFSCHSVCLIHCLFQELSMQSNAVIASPQLYHRMKKKEGGEKRKRERAGRGREREIFYPLTAKCLNSWGWAKMKSGAWNYIQVSHMGDRSWSAETIIYHLQSTLRESWTRPRARFLPSVSETPVDFLPPGVSLTQYQLFKNLGSEQVDGGISLCLSLCFSNTYIHSYTHRYIKP